MKKYKNANNDIYAFEEDGSQDHLIADEMVAITDVEADTIINPPLTADENATAIISKATSIIEAKYSPLKQRKMMSISISLLSVCQALTQDLIDANTWITAIRTIENTAITNGTLLADVDWTV